jgi:hypothetical protein
MNLFNIFGWILLILAGLSVVVNMLSGGEDSVIEAKHRPFIAVFSLLQFIWIWFALH